jgi:CHAD domain-containing protein
MERVHALRGQAKILRDLAERTTDHSIIAKLLAMAQETERLADSLGETLSRSAPPRSESN